MKNGFDKDALNFHNKTFTSTTKNKRFSQKSEKNTALFIQHIYKTSLDLL